MVRTASRYAVDMGPWEFIFPGEATARAMDSLVSADGLEVARPALSVSMGNPHTVVALAELAELDSTELFRAPRVDPAPPHGTNVEFVVPSEPLVHDGVGTITMRVHERGVGRPCPAAPAPAPPPSRSGTGPARALRTPGTLRFPAASSA